MQVTAVLHLVQLTALAVSAAKLPTPPSTLYGAPLADLPTHSQSAPVTQTSHSAPVTQTSSQSAQVPAGLSTLYEAPAADIPSAAQSSLTVQNPSGEKFPSVNPPTPVHQSTFVQSPGIEIPVPAVPSSLYELPSENLLKPVQQSTFDQSTAAGGSAPVPAQPPTQFDIPTENLPKPASPISVLSPVNLVPVPAQPSTLYDVPSEGTQFFSQNSNEAQASVLTGSPTIHQGPDTPSAVIPDTDQQSNLVQTAPQTVSAPAKPSTLFNTPVQSFPLPSQSSPQIQTPAAASQEQFASVDSNQAPVNSQSSSSASQVPTVVEIPQAPLRPSGLYEVPNEAQPTFNTNPINNIKGAPESLDTFSHGVVIPSEPSGLYEVPSENLPATTAFSPVHSVLQPEINVPAKASEVSILFPEQTSFQNQAPNLVPVPSVPSTLYETPEAVGKAMPSDNYFQSEYGAASSSVNTFSASRNSLLTSNVKGGMMMGMPYDFQWGVDDGESGNAFTHYETSDGKSTNGQYRVNLPDGRVQVVTFFDNGDGFNADVSYE